MPWAGDERRRSVAVGVNEVTWPGNTLSSPRVLSPVASASEHEAHLTSGSPRSRAGHPGCRQRLRR